MRFSKLLVIITACMPLLWTPVTQAAAVAEVGINDTFAMGQVIAPGSFTVAMDPDLEDDSFPTASISGDIGLVPAIGNNDVDFYCFAATANHLLYLDIDGGFGIGVNVDAVIFLFDATGTLIAFDDDTATTVGGSGSTSTLDSFVGSFIIPATGTYCVAVTSNSNFPNAFIQGGISVTPLNLGGEELVGATPDTTFNNGGTISGDYTLHISVSAAPIAIPALQPFALALLAGLLGLLGVRQHRRRGLNR